MHVINTLYFNLLLNPVSNLLVNPDSNPLANLDSNPLANTDLNLLNPDFNLLVKLGLVDSNLFVNPHSNLQLQLTAKLFLQLMNPLKLTTNLFLQLMNPLGVAGDQVSHVSDVHFVQQLGSNASFSQEGQFFRSQAVPSCRGVAAAVVTAVAGCTLGYLASRLYFRLRKGQKGGGLDCIYIIGLYYGES